MAKRRESRQQQMTAYARRAVERIEEASDPRTAAAEALDQAPDADHARALLEVSANAADQTQSALLDAALDTGDEELARVAAELLIDLGGVPGAIRLLRRCLDSDDETVRRRAIEAVENFEDPQAVDCLHPMLLDDATPVRRATTAVLSLIVGTPSHQLRRSVLDLLADPESDLSRAVTENEDDQVRAQIVQALSFAESQEVLPTLERLLHDEDTEVRQECVLCLAAIGTEDAVEMMSSRLSDDSYAVASTVLDMLAAHFGTGSSRLLESIRKAVRHPLPEVRRQAVLMLGQFDRQEVEPVLEEAAEDEDFEVARRAGELLRSMRGEARLGWLADELTTQVAGDRALPTWEAGNIGLEAGVGAQARSRGAREELDQIIPMLENAIRQGTASDKVHAINELSSLVDIAESPPMVEALNDPDPGVRSRAADALTYTRDAGLLVDVLLNHPDAMVRRRAMEALRENPGGNIARGEARATVTFTSTRTVGTELYSYFLRALHDEDTGVVQHACGAIRRCAQELGLVPMRQTLHELQHLVSGDGVAVLVQEDAQETEDFVRDADLGQLVAEGVADVLEYRGTLARHGHALQWDGDAQHYVLAPSLSEEQVEEWATAYRLETDEADELRQAAGGNELPDALAQKLLRRIARGLTAALECIGQGAAALREMAEEEPSGDPAEWAQSVKAEPRLQWRDDSAVASLNKRLGRQRGLAWIECQRAVATLAGQDSAPELAEATRDEDDWIKLLALEATAELQGRPEQTLARMGELIEARAGHNGYQQPVGRCAMLLVEEGQQPALQALKWALAEGQTDLRMSLTQRLMMAAQDDPVAQLLRADLQDRPIEKVADLCCTLALRGAGRDVADLDVADADSLQEPAAMCAVLALEAMDNRQESADRLVKILREESTRESYLAAWHLALARVRSSVTVFASTRDQEAAYMLQGLAAASLVRRGHSGGPSWFEKVLGSVGGEPSARLVTHLSRAVQDTIQLMLRCRDVNVGRFV